MNINTTDKVQTGNSTAGTSTSTTQHCPYTQHKAEQGWECPRCGRINAPWKSQCDCAGGNYWYPWDYKEPWWKQVYCDSDTFKVHPDSTIYQVSGSDYKAGNTYVNVSGTQSNKINPNVTAQNCTNPNNCHTPHYTTKTVVNDNLEPLTRHFKD